jgi:hypothetical protein
MLWPPLYTSGYGGGGGSFDTGANPDVVTSLRGSAGANGSVTITPITTAQPAGNVNDDGEPNYVMVLPETPIMTAQATGTAGARQDLNTVNSNFIERLRAGNAGITAQAKTLSDRISAGSDTSAVTGAQFITTEAGAKLIDTSGNKAVIAVGAGNSTLIGGAGNSGVIGGAGDDLFAFLNGHAGGHEDIYNFNGNDQLAFGGYTSNPIATEAVGATGDLIQLTDGTIINLVGVNHTVFS